MKKQALFMVVLLAAVGLLAGVAASNAFGYAGGFGRPCGSVPRHCGPCSDRHSRHERRDECHLHRCRSRSPRMGGVQRHTCSTDVHAAPPPRTRQHRHRRHASRSPWESPTRIYAVYERTRTGANSGGSDHRQPRGRDELHHHTDGRRQRSISPNGPADRRVRRQRHVHDHARHGLPRRRRLVNGASVGAVTTYTFTNVTANGTISATFSWRRWQTFSILASAGDERHDRPYRRADRRRG